MEKLSLKTTQAVIVTGPQGCGKTLAASAMCKHFGLRRVVDEWMPGQRLQPGALHLTCVPLQQQPGARVVQWAEVRHEVAVNLHAHSLA